MWLLELSLVRNEASTEVRRSRWRPEVAIRQGYSGPNFGAFSREDPQSRHRFRFSPHHGGAKLRSHGGDKLRSASAMGAKGVSRYPGDMPATASAPKRVLLAAPRGYCAGVDRAVQTVERALELHGAPVYVRKEIVHNKHVVEELAERGAIFVEEETEAPEGAIVVFSAHGVAPSVHENAAGRGLRTIDATCPLVTKVHVSARRFAARAAAWGPPPRPAGGHQGPPPPPAASPPPATRS